MDDSTEPLLSPEEKSDTIAVRPRYVGRKWMTVEPCLVLYFMAVMPFFPLQQQFVLYQLKLRHNISFESNDSTCGDNATDPTLQQEESQVGAEAANWMIILTAVALIPSLFVTTALGSFSDKAGRKVALIPPLVGGILRFLVSVVLIVFSLPLELLILAAFLEACSGGVSTFLMGSFASISDITTPEQRSFRIFILEVALGIGNFVSQIATGYVINLLGFMYPLIILGGIHVINLLYTVFLLPESRKGDLRNVSLFSREHFRKMWQLYTKDDESRRRWKLQLCLFLLFITVMVQLGSSDCIVYFLISFPLCFTPVLIGYYQALSYSVRNICGLLVVRLFTSRVSDECFMLLNNVSGIVFLVLIMLSYTRTMAFLAPLGALFFMLLVPMVRSMSSKLVSTEELGTVFAAIGMTESLAILIGSTVFDTIYSHTLATFKPLVFLVQIGVLVVGTVFIVILIFGIRKEKRSLHETRIDGD